MSNRGCWHNLNQFFNKFLYQNIYIISYTADSIKILHVKIKSTNKILSQNQTFLPPNKISYIFITIFTLIVIKILYKNLIIYIY